MSLPTLSHPLPSVKDEAVEPCVACGDPDVEDGDIFCIHCWASCPRYNEFFRTELKARLAWMGLCIRLYGEIRPFPGDRPVATKNAASEGQGSLLAKLHLVDLADYAGRYTQLTLTGPGKWRGLCPIHREKTPSFYLYADPWRWRCYGACAIGGDIVDLARELKSIGRR